MPTCPYCGATVPDDAEYCGKCGSTLKHASASTQQPLNSSIDPQLQARYEKELRRTELLSYAAAGLGIVVLVVAIVLSVL